MAVTKRGSVAWQRGSPVAGAWQAVARNAKSRFPYAFLQPWQSPWQRGSVAWQKGPL